MPQLKKYTRGVALLNNFSPLLYLKHLEKINFKLQLYDKSVDEKLRHDDIAGR
jgi:hypothetical protein